jgi:hypothetical protein
MQDLHRNNLAEWIMWLACLPLIVMVRAYFFLGSRIRVALRGITAARRCHE